MKGNSSPEAVRQLAYQLWLERGGVGGSPDEDWFRAEEILGDDHRGILQESALEQVTASGDRRKVHEKLDHAVEESFPASDPPAVHVKDEPPVNAGDKWKAVEQSTGKGGPRGGRRGGNAIV